MLSSMIVIQKKKTSVYIAKIEKYQFKRKVQINPFPTAK